MGEYYELNKVDLIERMANIFETIYIDEAQDLSGWDFDIIKVLAKCKKLNVVLCGDPRQNTYSTNYGMKYETYNGTPDKYAKECINTKRHQYIEIDYGTLQVSHRCCEEICCYSYILIPEEQKLTPENVKNVC